MLPRLLRITLAVEPDVIQTWLPQMDILGGLTAILSRRTWILSERSSGLAYPNTLKTRIRRCLGRRADAVVANSSTGARYRERPLGGRAPLHVIPNGIPLEEISKAVPSLAEYEGMRDRPMILYAGRFEKQKNIPALLQALRRLLARSNAWALLCAMDLREMTSR
jgi:glycosyltransferase involved in cell wall biosynthesis